MEHNSTCKAFPEVTEIFYVGMQDSLDEYTMAVIQHLIVLFSCIIELEARKWLFSHKSK